MSRTLRLGTFIGALCCCCGLTLACLDLDEREVGVEESPSRGGAGGTGGKQGLGDPCASNDNCLSGKCSGTPGWCTQTCSATNAGCKGSGSDGFSNSLGHVNWCVETISVGNFCFPACSTNADCTPYGVSALTCQSGTSVTGFDIDVCSL